MATANKIKLVSDRIDRAKNLLLSQFKDSPNINKMLEVFVNELQLLENSSIELQNVRTLKGSYGVFLDNIGNAVGVQRGAYTDQDYKNAIKIAMAKSNTSATREDILKIGILLSNDPFLRLKNHHPYMLEMIGFLECIAESEGGLVALAELFPVGTAIKIVQRKGKPFAFNTGNQGFGSEAKINSLVYHDYGLISDSRFSTQANAVLPDLPQPPSNISVPLIVGNNQVGSNLVVSEGIWDGDAPIVYTYQWLRNGSPISGQTTNSYTIVEADPASAISCEVTATNAVASSSALSNVISVDEVLPPEQEIMDGLGITDVYVLRPILSGSESGEAISRIDFNTDGTVVLSRITDIAAADIVNGQYLVTTGVGAGADYTISYTTISGGNATGLLPNVTYNLGTARFMQVSVSGDRPIIGTGTYAITVRSIPDPTISKTVTITITAEVGEFY